MLDKDTTVSFVHFGRKIAIGFSILVLMMMLLVAFIGFHFYNHTSKTNDRELQETITSLLAHSINRISFSGKYHARLLINQIVQSQPRIAYITIVNPQQKVIATYAKDKILPFFEKNEIKKVLDQEATLFRKVNYKDDVIQQIAMPYRSGYQDKIKGVIFVGIFMSKMESAKTTTQILMVILILILALISLIATQILSKKLAGPVIRLAGQFKGILDHVPLLIRISDQKGNIYAQSASFKIFSKNTPKLLYPEITTAFEGKKEAETELTHNQLSFLATTFPLFEKNAKTAPLVCSIALDITKRKEIEQELKNAQNYISNIINSMPSILVGIDLDGKIIQWNLEAERSLNIPIQDAIGKKINQMIPHLLINMDDIQHAISSREVHITPRQTHIKGDKVYYENITIYPLIANGVQGAVIRIDDITREYILEQQLNHSHKMDAIGQLAGGVAHDFNNMLAGIMGAAQLLKLPKRGLDQRGLDFIEMIIQSVTRAGDLTSKLLAFGRKGKIVLNIISIHQIINDTHVILSRTIDKKISIKMHLNANNDLVLGDVATLQSVLINLCINSSHAMSTGGTLSIRTKNREITKENCTQSSFEINPGSYIQIEVEDTGTGIPEKNIAKIFEPFFTTKEQGKGTGLGLAAVYGTVIEHNGAISVSSELNTGTLFTILLPLSDHHPHTQDIEEHNIKGTGLILLVDDEEIIRTTGSEMLEELGYNVLLAENGQKAINIFEQNHHNIDYVVMDMVMPVMNGRETFLKMISIDPKCKVIISSGFTQNENIMDLKEMGLAGFINKPFKDHQLSKLLIEIKQLS